MENPEAPKRRGWSIIRKAQVIGFIIGVSSSGLILFLLCQSPSGEMPVITFPMLIGELIGLPTDIIFQVLGLKSLIVPPPSYDPNIPIKFILTDVCAVGLINGILYFCMGTGIGWLIQKFKKKS